MESFMSLQDRIELQRSELVSNPRLRRMCPRTVNSAHQFDPHTFSYSQRGCQDWRCLPQLR
jgi:hypothetical protein